MPSKEARIIALGHNQIVNSQLLQNGDSGSVRMTPHIHSKICDVDYFPYLRIGLNSTMKEIIYDWGGANVWLFHAINDIRFEWLDQIMLLGTTLGDRNLFPFYLGVLAVFTLVVVNTPFQDTSHTGSGCRAGWLR